MGCYKRKLRVYERCKGLCFWCKKELKLECITHRTRGANGYYDSATVDHLVPVSRGGGNHQDNLVLSCGACNQKRGNDLIHPLTRKALKVNPLTGKTLKAKKKKQFISQEIKEQLCGASKLL